MDETSRINEYLHVLEDEDILPEVEEMRVKFNGNSHDIAKGMIARGYTTADIVKQTGASRTWIDTLRGGWL